LVTDCGHTAQPLDAGYGRFFAESFACIESWVPTRENLVRSREIAMGRGPDAVLYQFPERLHYDVYFRLDKDWILKKRWAKLPKASQSILPVIAAHCSPKGHAYPSQNTIAALSGLSEKEVRIGLKGLDKFPGFAQAWYVTLLGNWGKRYRLRMPRARDENRYIRIYRCIFDGGNWQALTRVGRALYPVLRLIAAESPPVPEDGGQQNPDGEVCTPVVASLVEYAGISRPSVYRALEDLERNWLVKYLRPAKGGGDTWKVYSVPPQFYPPATLNQALAKKFGWLLKRATGK
jgi:hypothetical protein